VRADYASKFPAVQALDGYRAAPATDRYDPHYPAVVGLPEAGLNDAYAAALAARERTFLRDLARRAFPQRRPVLHDFDCGHGQALRLLLGSVRTAYGYDTSSAALARARATGGYAQLRKTSTFGPPPAPISTDGPALVTVLAPRPATPAVGRDRAIAFAAQVLPDLTAGLLVLRDHSGPHYPRQPVVEIERLLTRYGFEVVERRGFTLCPPGGYAHPWLRPIAQQIDALFSRYSSAVALATEVLYVARRLPRLRPPRQTGLPQQR
jgi:hypothetical protein